MGIDSTREVKISRIKISQTKIKSKHADNNFSAASNAIEFYVNNMFVPNYGNHNENRINE